MITQIGSQTPLWVWALLAALLGLGWRHMQTREVTRLRLLALPLALAGWGLWSLAPSFMVQPLAGLLWLTAMGATAWWVSRRMSSAEVQWHPQTQRLTVPGSAWPMVLILALFCVRYGATVAQTMRPEWRAAPQLLLPLSAVYGLLSGALWGRSLAWLQMTRAQPR